MFFEDAATGSLDGDQVEDEANEYLKLDSYLINVDMKINKKKHSMAEFQGESTGYSPEALPQGWQRVPSRTRPGEYSYQNMNTGERVVHMPRAPAGELEDLVPFTVQVDFRGEKTLVISCGEGLQTFRWLATVAKQQFESTSTPRGRLRQRELVSSRSRLDYKAKRQTVLRVYRDSVDSTPVGEPLPETSTLCTVLKPGDKVAIY